MKDSSYFFEKLLGTIILVAIVIFAIPGIISSVIYRVQTFDEPLVFENVEQSETIRVMMYKSCAVLHIDRGEHQYNFFYKASASKASKFLNIYGFQGGRFINSLFLTRIYNNAQTVCLVDLRYQAHVEDDELGDPDTLTNTFKRPKPRKLVVWKNGKVKFGNEIFQLVQDTSEYEGILQMLNEEME